MAGGNVVTPESSRARRANKFSRLATIRRFLHLVHRAGILVAAISYFAISMQATSAMIALLQGKNHPTTVAPYDTQPLMQTYIGTTTIRQSPLVMVGLQGDVSPRNGTLYLEAEGPTFMPCTKMPPYVRNIYGDTFMRHMYASLVRDVQYNLAFLADEETELIAPVVDCLSTAVMWGYMTDAKFHFLTRKTRGPDDVYLTTLMLSSQEYQIAAQSERGSAAMGLLSHVNDMRAASVTHYYIMSLGFPYVEFNFRVYTFFSVTDENWWSLASIPDMRKGEIPQNVTTAFRSGFYMKSPTEQLNAKHTVKVVSTTPIDHITRWSTATKTVMNDSWGWLHCVQFFFGLDLLTSLVVLLVVMLRNLQAKKVWIGDAFVSISTKILFQGALVLLSWYLNGFWSLYEFCLHDAFKLTMMEITIYPEIIRADLLCIYLSLCGILGMIFRERVDPVIAMVSFGIGYELRESLIHMFPDNVMAVFKYAYAEFVGGFPPYQPGQELISPMVFWNLHSIDVKTALPFRVLLPILSTLVFVIAYIVYCKVYRFFVPEKAHVVRNTTGTGTSGGEEMSLVQKRVLTLFEIATGAELESRFGLIAFYEKYLIIKGMKFASADGIYSNGFVIANGKYVLQTRDYWSIVLMTVVRWQFTRVYVYEIAGSTVQQTAKLVYPSTFTLTDLVNLNISVLS